MLVAFFEQYPAFRVFEDLELFNKVKIDGTGFGISWNDDLDLSSDGIYLHGQHIGNTNRK